MMSGHSPIRIEFFGQTAVYRPIRNSADLSQQGLCMRSFEPPKDLRHVVATFWEYSATEQHCPIQVFPSGCCSLGFTSLAGELYGYFYGPITGSSVLGEFFSGRVYFGVAFQPGAELLLNAFSLGEIAGQRIDVADVWGQEIRQLTNNRLHHEHDARYAFLVELLRRVIRKANTKNRDCNLLVSNYLRQPTANIHELAFSAGVNDRRLRRFFHNSVGLSPKAFESIVRVQTALSQLVHTSTPIGQLATEAGFADQAHFTRRLRSSVGDSPLSFRQKVQSNRPLSMERSRSWQSLGYDIGNRIL